MCARHEFTNAVLLLEPEPGQETQVEEMLSHRVVLATAGPFFSALFTSGMGESRQSTPRISLPGVSVAAFRELRVEAQGTRSCRSCTRPTA
ncbi:hypothetical protein PF006_g26181 [Phytophthora fragariae]|uniref:BTB domain-containing protein n=1 Tax=Phytophthora fragariae TaxID=53985 RepID=A0A6A3QY04_9STRA|nr:hypothetical protein PF006_g26181 [Phytophthora fragariae]